MQHTRECGRRRDHEAGDEGGQSRRDSQHAEDAKGFVGFAFAFQGRCAISVLEEGGGA